MPFVMLPLVAFAEPKLLPLEAGVADEGAGTDSLVAAAGAGVSVEEVFDGGAPKENFAAAGAGASILGADAAEGPPNANPEDAGFGASAGLALPKPKVGVALDASLAAAAGAPNEKPVDAGFGASAGWLLPNAKEAAGLGASLVAAAGAPNAKPVDAAFGVAPAVVDDPKAKPVAGGWAVPKGLAAAEPKDDGAEASAPVSLSPPSSCFPALFHFADAPGPNAEGASFPPAVAAFEATSVPVPADDPMVGLKLLKAKPVAGLGAADAAP